MSRRSTSLAYGVLSLLVSTVRSPASPNVVSTSLALSVALLAIPPTAVSGSCDNSCTVFEEGPDDHIRSGPSATPPTRKRPVPVSTVSSSIISSLHGKCAPEDNGVSLNSNVWPGSTHPHGCRTYATPTGDMSKFTQPINSVFLLGSLPMTRSALVVRRVCVLTFDGFFS